MFETYLLRCVRAAPRHRARAVQRKYLISAPILNSGLFLVSKQLNIATEAERQQRIQENTGQDAVPPTRGIPHRAVRPHSEHGGRSDR